MIGVAVCAALAGTLYILVNEERRNNKERKKAAGSSGADGAGTLTAERLIEVLTESAHAAYQLIEQTRKMVHEKHVSTGQRCARARARSTLGEDERATVQCSEEARPFRFPSSAAV